MSEEDAAPAPEPDAGVATENAGKPRRKRRAVKAAKKFYVFETPRGQKPVLVSRGALPILKANTFARVGAAYGKHDRVVTTDPKGKEFRVITKFKAGSGKKVRAR